MAHITAAAAAAAVLCIGCVQRTDRRIDEGGEMGSEREEGSEREGGSVSTVFCVYSWTYSPAAASYTNAIICMTLAHSVMHNTVRREVCVCAHSMNKFKAQGAAYIIHKKATLSTCTEFKAPSPQRESVLEDASQPCGAGAKRNYINPSERLSSSLAYYQVNYARDGARPTLPKLYYF